MFHLIAFAAVVTGVKFMVIGAYGNVTPYSDQWDAEIDGLFRPVLEGTLLWPSLLATHNEHRIFTGKVLALLIFMLDGHVVNLMAEFVVNALLHVLSLVLILHALLRIVPKSGYRNTITLFASLLFALPLGFENIITNNSSFYFVILFSILFLDAMVRSGGKDAAGWSFSALVAGALACLSFASGALTLVAGIVLLAAQWLTGVRRDRSTLAIMLALIVMMVLAVHFTPTVAGHAHYRSRSIIDFLVAILKMTGGLVFYLPAMVFMFRQLREKPAASDPSWFLFGLLLWFFGQMVVLAYGRGQFSLLIARYNDFYTIGYVANFVALYLILKHPGRKRQLSLMPLRLWPVLFFAGIGSAFPKVLKGLDDFSADRIEGEARVRNYLATHDQQVLEEPGANIPYTDPARLKMLLDQDIVRSMLPRTLTSADAPAHGTSQASFSRSLFIAGWTLTGLGAGLFCTLFIEMDNNSRENRFSETMSSADDRRV